MAAAIWAPNLWWQATHDWPQLTMAGVIREDADFGGRIGLVPAQFLIMSPPLALIWVPGLWRLLRNPQARPYRFLGLAFLLVLGLVLVTGGREYYPAGAFPALMAAGAIAAVGWARRASFGLRRALLVALVAVNAVTTVAIALPVYPVRWYPDTIQAAINDDAGETIGWPELVDTVAGVYSSLPLSERATTVIITQNYGEAGAIDRYGPAFELLGAVQRAPELLAVGTAAGHRHRAGDLRRRLDRRVAGAVLRVGERRRPRRQRLRRRQRGAGYADLALPRSPRTVVPAVGAATQIRLIPAQGLPVDPRREGVENPQAESDGSRLTGDGGAA
nr:hypothetical protein GCM10020092_075760 [Actinoplanes digitatis]